MPSNVEHFKRKQEILQKALDVFEEIGFENTTMQKIADKCDITRTTLYIYFKNKAEIFIWSIKRLTDTLEIELTNIEKDKTLSAEVALHKMVDKVIDECGNNYKLFNVLWPYLLTLKESGANITNRVQRRIVKIRHFLSSVVIRGIDSGEFKDLHVKNINEIFLSIIESTVFRLIILHEKDVASLKEVVRIAVKGILK